MVCHALRAVINLSNTLNAVISSLLLASILQLLGLFSAFSQGL